MKMKKNIYIYGIAYYSNGKSKRSRMYRNPDAFSRWANAQWRKDHDVTVEETQLDMNAFEVVGACTWHQ